ncbi:uncharacterized protein LOC117169983 [Belonocnema kinseyi]|uniref:uncharacterized protein LOC117169983 n=1 Tax=Belonocnema kinseyi TaxID=2817044 RepID=UPI00143CC115|nr:uncharacterized protein LOC117169983 [Belonocnema kinseyi]
MNLSTDLELNAMEHQGSSSGSGTRWGGVRRGAGRPRGRESRRQDGVIHGKFRIKSTSSPKPVRLTRASDGFISHKGQLIEVWLNGNQRIVQADYPENKCPTKTPHGTPNHLVRLVILTGGQRLVECLDENGKLLGVRPSITTNANIMEPNASQWFFVYFDKIFRVTINPESKETKITLAHKNVDEVAQGKRCEEVDMAGFKFVVIRGEKNGDITGAEPLVPPPSLPIS